MLFVPFLTVITFPDKYSQSYCENEERWDDKYSVKQMEMCSMKLLIMLEDLAVDWSTD